MCCKGTLIPEVLIGDAVTSALMRTLRKANACIFCLGMLYPLILGCSTNIAKVLPYSIAKPTAFCVILQFQLLKL